MKVADLFIKIGVQGATKTKEELTNTRKGLGEVASAGLWAKAAIVGMLYSLERLVQGSNATGAAMQNMAGYTGLSAESLQRYAWAGKQANASAEEVQGSIMGIQKAMSTLETTGQGPTGLWVIARELKGFDKTKARDAFYMFDKLQEFAKTTKLPTAIANQALESFGLSAGTISAMRRNAFDPKQLAKANIYSDGQVGSLAKMNAQWSNLFDKWEKGMGRLNVKHGPKMIKDIDGISDATLRLVDALATLAEKTKIFVAIGKVLEALGVGVNVAARGVTDYTDPGNPKNNEKIFGKGKMAALFNWRDSMDKSMLDGSKSFLESIIQSSTKNKNFTFAGLPEGASAGGGTTVNQTQNFYGKADPSQVGKAAEDGAKRAVSDAAWQGNKTRKN